MKNHRRGNDNFWPLFSDPEDEVYENITWDLPGFRPKKFNYNRGQSVNNKKSNVHTRH